MPLARATTHTTAADGTFSAAGATAWNAAHTNAITGAISGGIPYFDSTTSEATSALLAAADPVLGGGAGTAPYTDAGFTGTGTGATYVATLNGLTVTAAPTFSALTSGRIPVSGTAGLQGDFAGLTYAFGTRSQLKVGTTSAGANLGIQISTSQYGGGFWPITVTPDDTNYTLITDANGNRTDLQGETDIYLLINQIQKIRLAGTPGIGPEITAGISTTNVAIESLTGTWNNAACATGWKLAITDTTSAAGALAWQVLGGASATTNLASLSKGGALSLNQDLALLEMTAPTGVANTARLFTQDLAGKTQLMVIFGTGVAQQIAIEV